MATGNSQIPKAFNSYFTNVVKFLEIPESGNTDQLYEQIQTPTLKAIVKFTKHPSKIAINNFFENQSFSFSDTEKKDISSEINNLHLVKLYRTLTFQSKS